MSIFTKDCPVCGLSQPSDATRCGCGHRFDASTSDGDTQDLQSIYHEERLYRDYLAARVDEAAKAGDKAALASARAELEAQEQRVRAVKSRIKTIRAKGSAERPDAPASTAPAPTKPAPVREVPLPKSKPAAPPRAQPPARPVASHAKPPSMAKPVKPPTPIHAKAPTAPKAVNTGADNGARQSPRVQGKQHANVATKPASHPKAAAAPVPRPSNQPKSGSPLPAAPAIADKPAQSFRDSQRSKSQTPATASAKPASQECPNCLAKVPPDAARCACGFEMPNHSDQMPALPMSPEDRAALLAALGPRRK